jgi:hypothetical protein
MINMADPSTSVHAMSLVNRRVLRKNFKMMIQKEALKDLQFKNV